MHIRGLIRATGALVLLGGLAACMDVDMELAILGKDSAQVTTTMSMDRSMYEMGAADSESDWCDDGEVTLDEDKATCTSVETGTFAELTEQGSGDDPEPTIVAEAGGRVRVTFPTSTMAGDMGLSGGDEEMDEETQQMMQAMFAGHSIVLRVAGGKIVETNMVLAEDGKSASVTMAFTDLINGTIDLPDESFAVVQLP